MRKVTIKGTVQLILEVEEGEDLDDVVSSLSLTLNEEETSASVVDFTIGPWTVEDSR